KAILFRLERPVVDGLGLRHLTLRPLPDLVRAGKRDADRAEVIDLEHGSPSRRRLARWRAATSGRVRPVRPGLHPTDERCVRCESVLEPGEVDPAEIREHVTGDIVFGQLDLLVVLVEDLRIQPKAAQLLDQDLEGFRDARRLDLLPLDDGFIRLDTSEDVIRLHGEQFLKDVRGAVRLERPDLHLAEALAAELGLATERLLGDQAVRAGRPGVDLVLDEVVELEHVDVADGDRAVEDLAGPAIAEIDLAVLGERLLDPVDLVLGLAQLGLDLVLGRPVEDGGRGLLALLVEGPAEMGLEDLADVHTARHAERVEDDVDRGPVRQERHVLGRQDLGDDTLVAVAAGHLVADADLPLLGDGHPDQAVDARLEVVVELAPELADLDDLAPLAVGQAEARVLHLAGLLAEDRPQEALLRGQLGLALRGDLADEDVARADLRPD